jgi:hypothetical protein
VRQVLVVVSCGVFGFFILGYVFTRLPARSLPESVVDEVSALPMRRKDQHVVDLETNDGRVIRNVWIAWCRYPALIGGRTLRGRYRPKNVVHARAPGTRP